MADRAYGHSLRRDACHLTGDLEAPRQGWQLFHASGPRARAKQFRANEPALHTPLDLRDLLAALHRTTREAWTRTSSAKIKVLIADPYHLFRQVLRRCLDERDDVEVVAEVASPHAYRRALVEQAFDVAIVASDLMSGTHTTSPLKPGDLRLNQGEFITGHLRIQPTIVLVADEDVDDYNVGLYDAPLTTNNLEESAINCVYVHRGAPAERLVEAMKSMLGVPGGKH